MRTEVILTMFIIVLLITIIVLSVLILMPSSYNEPTFDSLITNSLSKINSLSRVNITYDVNLSINNQLITGYMTYQRSKDNETVILSPSLKRFSNAGVMQSPVRIIKLINTSSRRDYAGYMTDNNITCPAVIAEPDNDYYTKIIGGDYLFVVCFNTTTGYPSIIIASETGNKTVYSKFFIRKMSYS